MGDVDSRLDPAYVARLDRKYTMMAVAMVVAAALAFVRWEVGLALAGTIILYHLRPPETPLYVDQAPIVEEEA
jgi:ABC-type transport system involved in cytochrome bd biosynthesis fused ATPase/permease subunit